MSTTGNQNYESPHFAHPSYASAAITAHMERENARTDKPAAHTAEPARKAEPSKDASAKNEP